MSEDHTTERLSTMIDGFAEHLERVKQAQQQRVQLVVEAHAAGERVTVQVNADGALVDLRFAEDIDELDYAEIATAVLMAAREAAAMAAERVRKLLAPLQARPAAVPTIAEFQHDDTLSGIAERFGIDWHTVYSANRAVIGDDPNELLPGQRLKIPSVVSR
jgi:DNA-binding protein YbaB